MGIKRPAGAMERSSETVKRQRKGFQVGPANLPEGEHKRKTQQIKRHLIEKAKIKKDYAKLKSREPASVTRTPYSQPEDEDGDEDEDAASAPPASTERHPARQQMIESAPAPQDEEDAQAKDTAQPRARYQRQPKAKPFARQQEQADQRKTAAEERFKAYEESQRQRQSKLEDRERFRRAMAKARSGGRDGQRKLGRESKVLLEKVQRMVSEA